jgi:hypothetical protein
MKIKPVPKPGIQGALALREAASTELGQIIKLVQAALVAKLKPAEATGYYYVEIEAIFPDRVIVCRDGRYYSYAYTLGADNQVTLGATVEVVENFTPVGEAAMAESATLQLREAEGADKGLIWEATLIRAGVSKGTVTHIGTGKSEAGAFYSDQLLRESVALFEGRPVFAKADKEHRDGEGKDVNKLIGWISDAKFVEGSRPDTGRITGRVNLSRAAQTLRTLVVDAWERGKRDLVGLSIDAVGKAKPGKIGGALTRVVESIKKVLSVDLIVEPGAGGALVRMVESLNPQEENDMKLRERMLRFIEAKAPEVWKKIDADKIEDEALETAYREALAVEDEAKKKAEAKATGPDVKPAAPVAGVTREELNETTRMIEARATMRGKIGESGLPDLAKAKLRKQFDGLEKFTEAQVDEAIKGEREYLARMTESGKPRDLGDLSFIEAGEQRADKVKIMLDDFFSNKAGCLQSFKECYRIITGDRLVTGMLRDCDPVLLRESLSDAGNLDVVLGDAIQRRMVADYRDMGQYDVYRSLVNVVPLSDFRTKHLTRFGGYGDLPTVLKGAPYTALVSPSDEEATYAPAKRGGTEDIALEDIRNDDVGLIRRVPVKLSRASKRTLAKFVLDFIRTNPLIYDGVALFDAAHNNLGSAALDATSVAARRLAMLQQTEAGSTDRIGIGPKFIWVPSNLQQTAVDLFNRNTNLDKTFIQSLSLMVMPVWYWSDATDWALSADPNDIPTLELGFLDGKEEPEIFVQDSPTSGSMFSHDKLTWKIRHIFGAAVEDFRGLDKSVVAG